MFGIEGLHGHNRFHPNMNSKFEQMARREKLGKVGPSCELPQFYFCCSYKNTLLKNNTKKEGLFKLYFQLVLHHSRGQRSMSQKQVLTSSRESNVRSNELIFILPCLLACYFLHFTVHSPAQGMVTPRVGWVFLHQDNLPHTCPQAGLFQTIPQ